MTNYSDFKPRSHYPARKQWRQGAGRVGRAQTYGLNSKVIPQHALYGLGFILYLSRQSRNFPTLISYIVSRSISARCVPGQGNTRTYIVCLLPRALDTVQTVSMFSYSSLCKYTMLILHIVEILVDLAGKLDPPIHAAVSLSVSPHPKPHPSLAHHA